MLGQRCRPRGGVLLLVLLLLFLILTALVAMFQMESVTRTESLRTDADLQARQAARFEVGRRLHGTGLATPPWLRVSLTTQEDSHLTDGLSAEALFAPDGLPDLQQGQPLSFDRDALGYPGNRYLQLSAGGFSLTGGLPMPRGSIRITSSGFSRYAAVTGAEQSQSNLIELERVAPFANPIWGKTPDPTAALAGPPPVVSANGPVQVDDFPYGVVRCDELQTRADAKHGGPIAYPGTVEIGSLIGDLEAAMDALDLKARAADRTPLLQDGVSPTESLGLFFTQFALPAKLKERLSLRQSQDFWLPVIPGLQKQFFVLYHLVFHVPDRPDGGLDDVSVMAQKVLTTLIDLIMQLEKAKEYLDEAIEALNRAVERVKSLCDCATLDIPCWAVCGVARAALELAKLVLEAAKLPVTLLEQALLVVISPVTLVMEAALVAGGQMPPPGTRSEEAQYQARHQIKLDKGGMDYWAYRSIFSNIGRIIGDLFTGEFDKIGREFGSGVNVVFFGQPDKAQRWAFSPGAFEGWATWNVPRARTFYYNGRMTLHGDLLVGRGATMVVNGDLSLLPGEGAATGRLFLEEGASLVVHGNLRCSGSATRGSVVLGSPMGKVNSVTSAILCEGDVILPYGVLPGVSLDAMRDAKGGKLPTGRLFEPLLEDAGPTLAKLAGPFHIRHPYVARYATTFEFIAGLDIPMVIPISFPNLHVYVFRGLSYLYAPTLNFTLGDNLMTHTDWWGRGGEGRVPMLVKAEAVQAAGALASSSFDFDDDLRADRLVGRLQQRSQQIGTAAVDKFANALCLQLMAEWMKIGTLAPRVSISMLATLMSELLRRIDDAFYNLDQIRAALDSVVPDSAWSGLSEKMTEFWTMLDAAVAGWVPRPSELLQECPGALVYAGGRLAVGEGISNRPPLAVGWFVARGDLTMNCERTVGSLISLQGRIRGGSLYFYPPFTRASLFVPQAESDSWIERGKDHRYGAQRPDGRPDAEKTRNIGPTGESISSWSWEGAGR